MFKQVNLELSAKVFKKTDPEYVNDVINRILDQWHSVIKNREEISFLLWLSDGSEILDYTGDLDKSFEWGYFSGCANKPELKDGENIDVNLHTRCLRYIDNLPIFTYRILKRIIKTLKSKASARYPDTNVLVGTPFDIGPEFAISEFKYTRHPEICTGNGEGGKTFINSYGVLSSDSYHYAGFPDGIPEGTPFGTFLGRQTRIYAEDIGFDYLWLSNGVGFSASSWDPTGEIFDGKVFHTEKFSECERKIFDFWKLFREECPTLPIHTRGTNFSAGIDHAVDAVPLKRIYDSKLNITPPPNSPWASINGNYGLELMGHMTRNCELPDEDFMFRFYLHDCWWINSPWYDRYTQSPHDIYLPASIGRIDGDGKVSGATLFDVFTLDNTFGNIPDNCANEVIPHLLKAEKDMPDAVAPLVWVYPLAEFSEMTDESSLKRIISGDLFICRAITNGLPLNTIISSDNFRKTDKSIYRNSVILTPVPKAESEIESSLLEYAREGGAIVFYGSADEASRHFLDLFKINLVEYENEKTIELPNNPDSVRGKDSPKKIVLRHDLCGSKTSVSFNPIAKYKNSTWYQAPNELQSLNYDTYSKSGIDSGEEYLHGSAYLREILKDYGCYISHSKPTASSNVPMMTVSRSNNAFVFSVYNKCQPVSSEISLKDGAPILDGYEVEVKDGKALYSFPKCEHKECRVFVKQKSGIVSVCDMPPVSRAYRRKIMVSGLKNATVRFYPESYCKNDFAYRVYGENEKYENDAAFGGVRTCVCDGKDYVELTNISGTLLVGLPYKKSQQKTIIDHSYLHI